MDNHNNHLMHPGYGNLVYPPQEIPPISSILSHTSTRRFEELGQNAIGNTTTAGADHIFSDYGAHHTSGQYPIAYSTIDPIAPTATVVTHHSISGLVTPTPAYAPVAYPTNSPTVSTSAAGNQHSGGGLVIPTPAYQNIGPIVSTSTATSHHNICGLVTPTPALAPIAYPTIEPVLTETTVSANHIIRGRGYAAAAQDPVAMAAAVQPAQSPVPQSMELNLVKRNAVNLSPVVALDRIQVLSQTIIIPARPKPVDEAPVVIDSDDSEAEEEAEDEEDEEVIRRVVEKGKEIDKNQCRICLSKDQLVNIFKYDDERNLKLCDIIMMLCTPLRISVRDYLPHFVCTPCMDKLLMVYDLKLLVEETDKELRAQLKRSKVKSMASYVVVDGGESSSGGSDDEKKNDDDEFHLSEADVPESDDDSSDDGAVAAQPRNRPTRRKCAVRSCSNHAAHSQLYKRKGPEESVPENKRTHNDAEHMDQNETNEINQTQATTE